MAAMNIWYNPEKWRLFVDSSMHSLKAVLLHKGNVLPSIHCLCCPQKGNIKNMKEILRCMNYKNYQWPISSDLKVIALWMELQKVEKNSVIS
jgi:hypothetical protein